MYDKKIGIDLRVLNVAEKYNVSQNVVHEIISSYILRSRDELLHGHRIDFFGLVSVVPNPVYTRRNSTLAYVCHELSGILKLPWNTVFVIIREYIDCLISDVLSGRSVEVRGVVTVNPIFEGETLVTVRSSISSAIRRMIDSGEYPITSARVHTYHLLRDAVARLSQAK